MTFNVIAAITALYLTIYYRRENAKRDAAVETESAHEADEKAGGVERAEVPVNLHDMAPGFRYFT